MTHFRISEAAELAGVSDDTVRRWVRSGALNHDTDAAGRQVVRGADLAALITAEARTPGDTSGVTRSARNRFIGLVTEVQIEGLMAQVELQCGPHRVVSVMTAEAARDLDLKVGDRALAAVKATMVSIERGA